MPIKLFPPRSPTTSSWYGRGTHIGVAINRSTKTSIRKIAVQVVAQWEREIERGEFAVDAEPTFASAAAAYMKAGGERTYLTKLLEYFRDTPLSRIDQQAIDAAAAVLYPGATGATQNRSVYTPISAVRHHAGDARPIRRPRGASGSSQTAWLWPEQAQAIFTEAEKLNPKFAALLITLCYTGMRLSEALGLDWNRVRLAESSAYLPDTKTGEPRTVFLPPVVVAALKSLPEPRCDRVFHFTKSGHLYHLHKAAFARAGVDMVPRSNFHIWRHTFASWMRRYSGLDAKGLLATGAWKDAKSADRYTHVVVSEEAQRAALLPTRDVRKLVRNPKHAKNIKQIKQG